MHKTSVQFTRLADVHVGMLTLRTVCTHSEFGLHADVCPGSTQTLAQGGPAETETRNRPLMHYKQDWY